MTARVGKVAYQLDLLEKLSQIPNIFHVSQLRKCLVDDLVVVSLDNIKVDELLNHAERLISILDRR